MVPIYVTESSPSLNKMTSLYNYSYLPYCQETSVYCVSLKRYSTFNDTLSVVIVLILYFSMYIVMNIWIQKSST